MNFLDYVYYRISSWYHDRFGEDGGRDFSPFLIVVILIIFNLATILWMFEGLLRKTILTDRHMEPKIGGAIYIVGVLVGYLAWHKEPRHTKIVDKYSSENLQERKNRSVYFRAYVVLSLFLPIFTAVFIRRY